jgi:transposase
MGFQASIISFLGLRDVEIEDIKQFKSELRAVIVVRSRQDRALCHDCFGPLEGVHEWILKELKGPPMGVYQEVKIKFYHLRSHCKRCAGNRMSMVDWIHPKCDSMTCGFSEVAGRMMEETTCEAVARLLMCDSMTLWRLDQWRMQYMMGKLKLPENVSYALMSADEVHFRTIRLERRKTVWSKRWEMKYITNLVSYEDGKVLFNSMGRDSQALKDCLSILSPGQKLAVEKFAVDMHEPFIQVVKKELSNAEPVIDRFHVVKKINEAFDSVRKSEFRKARDENKKWEQDMLHPHRRFILVSREKDLSRSEMKMLEKLRAVNQNIHTAMLLVEYLHTAIDKPTVPTFRKALLNWYWLAREAGLEPFRKFAKLIRRYRKGIEAYIKSGLTTAVSEGLNNKIKTLKRMGYGYTNPQSFRRKTLQRCGYLNHYHINTNQLFFTVPNPTI